MRRISVHFVALFAATTLTACCASIAAMAQVAPPDADSESPIAHLAERQNSDADELEPFDRETGREADDETTNTADANLESPGNKAENGAGSQPESDVAPPVAATAPSRRPARPAVAPARTRLRAFDNIGPIEADAESSAPNAGRGKHGHIHSLPSDNADATAARNRRAVQIDRAKLREVTPGVSTVADLDANWGTPINDQTRLGSGKRNYEFAPFDEVTVELVEGLVTSISGRLAKPSPYDETAREFLSVGDGDDLAGGVEIQDDGGHPLGVAFPERGIVFGYHNTAEGSTDRQHVSQVLLDPIDTALFLLRAERNQHQAPLQSLADVEYVLEKDARNGAARLLAARIYIDSGQLTEAAGAIDAALKIEPTNAGFLLTKAEILAESGDFTSSREICERVIKQKTLAPEFKAKAQCQMGDCLANGPNRDYRRAMEFHLAALKTAQPFVESPVAAQRRLAKHVLVAAQLGAANDIAWGNWQQKERAVPKWLAQAHHAALDLIDQEGADELLHLILLRKALAASAGMQGKLDPVAWTKEAIKSGRTLIDATDDPWRRARLEWELGLALYDALQADQARGYHDHALSNSSLVAKYLESALVQRQETPQSAYLVGRLYFRVGSIHAVELSDHETAAGWYAKALPLLQRPLPTTAVADMGRLGESFVSMGISYWETGRRDEAIRITKHGVSLISQGVKQRVIEEDALAVPYSNLAFMHRELGRAKEAENFAVMATRIGTTKRQ